MRHYSRLFIQIFGLAATCLLGLAISRHLGNVLRQLNLHLASTGTHCGLHFRVLVGRSTIPTLFSIFALPLCVSVTLSTKVSLVSLLLRCTPIERASIYLSISSERAKL